MFVPLWQYRADSQQASVGSTTSRTLAKEWSMSSSKGHDRRNSGGYDFGGYVPGADYTPRHRPKWQALVAVLLIVGLVGFSAFLI